MSREIARHPHARSQRYMHKLEGTQVACEHARTRSHTDAHTHRPVFMQMLTPG